MSSGPLTFFPPTTVSRAESGLLQNYLDDLGPTDGNSAGGILQLPRGHFYGNLTVSNQFVEIRGHGDGTVIHGSVLCTLGYCSLNNLWVMGTGQGYGIRLSGTIGGVGVTGSPRNRLNRVRVGASFEGAGDGPVNCLELDGAIVGDIRNSLFLFGTGSGLFMDTTDPTGAKSTNVNHFYGCTFNGNTRYGCEIVGGGIMAPSLHGGNIESNGLGGYYARSVTNLVVEGVDFEHDNYHPVSNLLDIGSNCNPFKITDCNVVIANSGAGGAPPDFPTPFTQPVSARGFLIDNCHKGTVARNRFSGFNPGRTVPVITVAHNCSNVEIEDGGGFDSKGGNNNYIEHRGYWT